VSGTSEVTVKHNLGAFKHKTVLPSKHTAKKRKSSDYPLEDAKHNTNSRGSRNVHLNRK